MKKISEVENIVFNDTSMKREREDGKMGKSERRLALARCFYPF
jgi:hypothetical protein